MPSSSFKANLPQLRLGVHGVRESEDEEEEEVGRPSPNRGGHHPSLACPPSPDEGNEDFSERSQPSKRKSRAQSARRPSHQNGHGKPCPDSPVSGRSHPAPHRPVPPKSAPNLRQKGQNKGTPVKSRNGVRDSAEFRPSSPSPHRSQGARPDATAEGRRGSIRPSPRRRRQPSSRSEDLSCSSEDPHSPRLSVSEQQQHNSLNGTLSSSDGSDDSRHTPMSARGHAASVPTAWDAFEEHVRTIHDSSDMFSRYRGPSFHASSTFLETMTDLFGYPNYARPPGAAVKKVASRGMVVAGAANRFLKLRKSSTQTGMSGGKGGDKNDVVVADKQTVENAKRGWRVLKLYVQENYTSKRTSQAALSWSMLRHTLKGMSDREKTRMDLYRRYGIVPTLDHDGNLVNVNTMLSERARQAIASGSRYPLLVHTARTLPMTNDKPPTSAPSLNNAGSSSSLLSPRSPGETSNAQRRVRSSGIRSARPDVRSSVGGTRVGSGGGGGGGGGVPLRNGTLRKSADFASRTPTRSHTP